MLFKDADSSTPEASWECSQDRPARSAALTCVHRQGSWGARSLNGEQRPFSFTRHLSSFPNSFKFLTLFILSGYKIHVPTDDAEICGGLHPRARVLSGWAQPRWLGYLTPFPERTYETWRCLGINLPRPAEGGRKKKSLVFFGGSG